MKDSQPGAHETINVYKYIKANNERFSTVCADGEGFE